MMTLKLPPTATPSKVGSDAEGMFDEVRGAGEQLKNTCPQLAG